MIRMSSALVRCLFIAFLALASTASGAHAQTPTFTPFQKMAYMPRERKWGGLSPPRQTVRHGTRHIDNTIKTGQPRDNQERCTEFADGRATIETKLDEPGMIYVRVTADDATQRAITLGAAVGPTHLRPSAPRPVDFDAFWDQKLRDLRGIPMVPVLAPRETSAANVDLFAVTLASLGSTVHGYLARPSREGRFPALRDLPVRGGLRAAAQDRNRSGARGLAGVRCQLPRHGTRPGCRSEPEILLNLATPIGRRCTS